MASSIFNNPLIDKSVLATKNATYVGDNHLYVTRIGNLVNVSGRFQVTTAKPAGQSSYLFTDLPQPISAVDFISPNNNTVLLIVGSGGHGILTSNGSAPTGYYNVQFTYLAT